MLDFVVDRDLCVRCGNCVATCNRGVLADDGEGGPRVPAEFETLCNFCGHCSAVCPAGAIVSPGCGGERAMPLPAGAPVDFAAAGRFILSCRSIRRYTEEPVGRDDILELLDIARRAPSGGNAQTLRWMVLRGEDKARRFTALNMEWFDTVVRRDPELSRRYNVDRLMARYENGHDPILRGASCAVFALTDKKMPWGPVDAAVAMTYFCLAAHAKNIGSCWCGFGMLAAASYPPLREFLGLDGDAVVEAMAFFGHPAVEYHAVPPRKPLKISWL